MATHLKRDSEQPVQITPPNKGRVMQTENKSKLQITDHIAMITLILSSLTIIITSIFRGHSLDSWFNLIVSFIAPGVLVVAAYLVYKAMLNRVTGLSKHAGGLLVSLVLSVLMISAYSIFEPIRNWEEGSISSRFYYTRGGGVSLDEKVTQLPEKSRRDIQIIGITTKTREFMGTEWPIPWKHYANIINVFKDTEDVILMFDIFFLDYKKGQMETLQKAMAEAKNAMLDYPVYSTTESKEEVKNLEKRVSILREKYLLKNVIDPDDAGKVWLSYAIPPIENLSAEATGLGFANIRKEEGSVNRKMPMVVKLLNHGTKGETEYYPSIDLLIVCKYYGIDPVKDTEIVMGKHVKLKNIPKKELTAFNPKTFEKESKDIMTKPNVAREIVIPIDIYGQMQINFVGGKDSFKYYNLHEISTEWDSDVPANNSMQNHIFLIAMYYATGVDTAKDQHNSPFGEISGVEHHANAINTVLNQDFLSETPIEVVVLIFLFSGLFLGYLQPRVATLIGFLLILILVPAYILLSFYLFAKFNLITPLPSVALQQALIFISVIGLRIFAEEENVKYIKNTFSKFVSSDVVDELLKDPSKIALGGSKKEITIFFSDIRGFTTMSEALGPEELVKLLNEYLSAMTEIILEYKGTIDKYMGDAIMAFWGAPIELEDHSYYACVAALYQMQHLKKMQAVWKSKNLPSIDIGIGLNSGQAVVGNMGSSHRMEYTCMGDTINLGSRLEGSNKMYGTNIIISEYTYERVKERVYARELDLVKVKGKTQPVRIYELIGLINDSDFEKIKRPLSTARKK
jgi:adenylate cyclase